MTRSKAKKIRLDIKRNILEDLAYKARLVKAQKQKVKSEIKEANRIKKAAKRLKRKEKTRHFILKLKNIFKRKRKK